jgi:hypothetical protein
MGHVLLPITHHQPTPTIMPLTTLTNLTPAKERTLNLPSLEYLTGNLGISSYSSNFNCTPFKDIWSRLGYASTGHFSCQVFPPTTQSGLSTKKKLEIGLGVSISCTLIICLGAFWSCRLWIRHQAPKSTSLPLQRRGDPR